MSLTVKMLPLIDDAVLKFELGHSVFELGLSFGLPESFFYLSWRLEVELSMEVRFLPLKIFLVFVSLLFSSPSSNTKSWQVYSQFPIIIILLIESIQIPI